MTDRTGEGLTPIFVTVKDAAGLLALSPWTIYRLCEKNAIASRMHGRRRLVSVESIKQYANNLPTQHDAGSGAA